MKTAYADEKQILELEGGYIYIVPTITLHALLSDQISKHNCYYLSKQNVKTKKYTRATTISIRIVFR